MSPPSQSAGAPALRVGLTGGIASGKSTVAREFAALGVPVIDADEVARELTQPGEPLCDEILTRFDAVARQRLGASLRDTDGNLDRTALRRLVFEDAELRRQLEALLHPRIRARMEALGQQRGGPYQIHVVPLLVETGAARRYDRVLLVDAPEALQLARLQARDDIGPEQARSMLAAQASRATRLAAAHDVITNDGAPAALASQVATLDQRYRELASRTAERR